MVQPICPLCRAKLLPDAAVWRCENGHCFDVARQGYVNLLPVSQKHSLHPGDTKEMVAARREFLASGLYAPIAETLCALLAPHAPETVLDVGCGEGYYLSAVGRALPDAALWGIDISKDAVRYAAGANKRAQFLTASAAHLPFPDGSFSAVVSMFALTCPEEFARVMQQGGIFVQVLAGAAHLLGLKRIIYPEIIEKEKTLHPTLPGFTPLSQQTLEFEFELETNRQIQCLFSMTPHVFRITEEGAARLRAAKQLRDRAQVIFNVYRADQDEG